MIAYKVVTIDRETGKLFSTLGTKYHASVEYKVGIPSYPREKLGPLLAFETFRTARVFQTQPIGIHPSAIYKCEVILSERQDYDLVYAGWIQEYWEFILLGKTREISTKEITYPRPYGTVFCNSITLLEKAG